MLRIDKQIRKTHPPGSREETKERLIHAGLEIFGNYGFEAATTRMLAKTAGVNLAAIPYHFGGKEGLYVAVLDTISERIHEALASEREAVHTVVKKKRATRKEMLNALESLVRAFARIVISSEVGGQFGPLIMREQMNPTSAFELLYNKRIKPLHLAITTLVARLTGEEPDREKTIIRAHTILGQIVAFRAMRATALRRLDWNTFDAENTETVCSVIVENMHQILKSKQR